jgi:cell division septal protein FtsQ
MSDKNYKSSNLIKRKKQILRIKIVSFFVLAVLIVVGLAYLSNSDSAKISNIYITDTTFSNKKEIEKIVKEEMEGNYLFVFAKDNIFLFPKHEIEERIKNFSKSIKKTTISLSGLQSISVNIEEYKPTAVWCNETDCFYLNEEGLVFDKAPIDYDKNLVQFHDWIHDNPIGKNYTDSETFEKIIKLIEFVSKVPMKVTSINTEDGLTFYLHTEAGTRLLYEINDDPEAVANNLNTVLAKDAINRAQLNNIDYIDLRFGNKVYYKIR